MTVCHLSPSEVDSQFIGTTGTTGDNDDSGGSGGSGTINFSTFLFHTFGIGVRVASGDLDLLYRL